ncbi:Hemerythrin-like metal-binding protein [Magnetospirillum sp. LM-5]|uniref:bacteriohemerythrin n=1 Tax=Magnetospirillum sp. LM-5 TaxID=2681466 RepID=UPI00137CDA35|nr:hemerythrin domain-containing protein [Magnetospirillum sp. LM-5]CAA7621844.1 Hemerythrin-like metal-binding protein [Magnetospirillum sp. LM-5]
MPVLQWDDGLNVGVGFMDADHVVAAEQINGLADAADAAQRAPLLAAFIDHCRHHFAREEGLMEKTGFFALGCHRGEHQRVLSELAEVQAKLEAGESLDAYFRDDLPNWLMIHRNTMDAITAEFARSAGYTG